MSIDLVDVGRRLRDLRSAQGLSIRALAEKSELNVNTLSMIENGKTSPSVATLEQLALALETPIAAFFENDGLKRKVIFQKSGQRRKVSFAHGMLEDLSDGIVASGGEPFLVTLDPHAGSGEASVVHTGREFVFCLEGCLVYTIEQETFTLEAGDSLIFEAHLPHRWENTSELPCLSLLVMCPSDENDHPMERHFSP